MGCKLLAELVVVLHFAFIVFVLGGGLLATRWPRVLWFHLPAAAWAVFVELSGWTCPLTPLENWLRHRAGEAGYAEGFVAHYLLPIIYPAGLPPGVHASLAVFLVAVNVLIYGWLFLPRSRAPRSERGGLTARPARAPGPAAFAAVPLTGRRPLA